jgi:hypothetical protein
MSTARKPQRPAARARAKETPKPLRRAERPSVAVRRSEARERLQRALLAHYERDAEVDAELLALVPAAEAADVIAYGEPPASQQRIWATAELAGGDQAIVDFVRSVDQFVARSGLDRLGDVGRAYVVAWCSRYIRARRSRSAFPGLYGPERLSTSPLIHPFKPDIVGIVRPPWREETWDLTREARSDARTRLERTARDHIRRELDLITEEAHTMGLTFPGSPLNVARDLEWLYQRMRLRRSYQDIYESMDDPPEGGADTIRRAVERIAEKAGVSAAGWETGWR